MIEIIKKIFGLGPSVNYAELVKAGAIILDVRSKGEFASGHINGSLNIPVDQLEKSLGRLPDKEETIITVCASGMRSAAAKRLLTSKGYSVHNAGSWISLQNKIHD
jgi:rhodanese-related sulfurtransferase